MAVDRPGDYVGNHGGVYTDMEGQSRQFTYIDHDPKITGVPKLSRAYKEPEKRELTQAEILAGDIQLLGIQDERDFIQRYDEVIGKQFGFERYKKGKSVDHLAETIAKHGVPMYNAIQKLFKQCLKDKVRLMKEYISKEYRELELVPEASQVIQVMSSRADDNIDPRLKDLEGNDYLRMYRKILIERVLDHSATFAPEWANSFTLRGDRATVQWNETMLNDPGLDLNRLRELCVQVEIKAENINKGIGF